MLGSSVSSLYYYYSLLLLVKSISFNLYKYLKEEFVYSNKVVNNIVNSSSFFSISHDNITALSASDIVLYQ